MLSLREALAKNRLNDFVTQAENEGVGPADRTQFDTLIGAITAPQPEDRTSRSPGHGGSRGK